MITTTEPTLPPLSGDLTKEEVLGHADAPPGAAPSQFPAELADLRARVARLERLLADPIRPQPTMPRRLHDPFSYDPYWPQPIRRWDAT